MVSVVFVVADVIVGVVIVVAVVFVVAVVVDDISAFVVVSIDVAGDIDDISAFVVVVGLSPPDFKITGIVIAVKITAKMPPPIAFAFVIFLPNCICLYNKHMHTSVSKGQDR